MRKFVYDFAIWLLWRCAIFPLWVVSQHMGLGHIQIAPLNMPQDFVRSLFYCYCLSLRREGRWGTLLQIIISNKGKDWRFFHCLLLQNGRTEWTSKQVAINHLITEVKLMYDLSLRHSFNLLGFSIICIQLYVNCFCFLMREMSHELCQSHFSQQNCGHGKRNRFSQIDPMGKMQLLPKNDLILPT